MVNAAGKKERGLFIVVEGCDRTGKTTQCQHLIEWIKEHLGVPCEYQKFPDRSTPIGQIIDKYLTGQLQLNDQAIHLLFSANRWELKSNMEGKLKKGIWLVLDRYVESGVAYSVAKGLSLEWCKMPDQGLPAPDLTIFLDLTESKATTQRDGFGAERYEEEDFQAKVRKCYTLLKTASWTIVDGEGTIEEVGRRLSETCEKLLGPLVKERSLQEIRYIKWS